MIEKNTDSVGIVETRTIRVVEQDEPLPLECGKTLGPIDVAYETYGQLNEAGDNAILICHALSGNAHVAGLQPRRGQKARLVGDHGRAGQGHRHEQVFRDLLQFPGRLLGHDRAVAPSIPRPAGPTAWTSPSSPSPTWSRSRSCCSTSSGIKHLLAVIGGSIGGMQVLQWAIAYPEMMDAAIPIATTTHLGAQSIAFDAVGRNAILADANFANGQYHNGQVPGQRPGHRPHDRAHHLPLRAGHARRSSAGSCAAPTSTATTSTRSSPSRPTWTTRASRSSSGSTPTATSTSPRPPTTSICRGTTARWKRRSPTCRPGSSSSASAATGSSRRHSPRRWSTPSSPTARTSASAISPRPTATTPSCWRTTRWARFSRASCRPTIGRTRSERPGSRSRRTCCLRNGRCPDDGSAASPASSRPSGPASITS